MGLNEQYEAAQNLKKEQRNWGRKFHYDLEDVVLAGLIVAGAINDLHETLNYHLYGIKELLERKNL